MGAPAERVAMTPGYLLRWLCSVTAVLALSMPAAALQSGNTESTISPTVVAIDEAAYLGTPLNKDVVLIDESGREFTLGERMGKPLILLFSYYTCDGVCGTLNLYLANRLREMEQSMPDLDYRALTISFDKKDTVDTLNHFMTHVGVPERLKARWSMAVVKNPEDIKPLTDSLGIRYFWSYRDRVFVHPNAFVFVTPKGRVARYLHGALFSARDVELALVDADWERISNAGRIIDILASACFSYNYAEGRYTINYPLFIGGASLLAGILLVVIAFSAARKRKLRSIEHA